MTIDKKTPLYDAHIKSKGKMVSYGGYLMPVQYGTGLITEHLAVRNNAGMFDVSHMGEIIIKGKDALDNLQYILTNDFTTMKKNQVKYSPMCYTDGGTVDDLLVYKLDDSKYLLIVNAANHEKDLEWIKSNVFGEVIVEDISENKGLIAIQGPKAEEILLKLVESNNLPAKNYTFLEDINISNINTMISRTGYTGEDGFEIMCDSKDTNDLWELLLATGEEFGLIPAGLGARDTLRLEAGMPLYGHELSKDITPLEAGLKFAVKMDKKDFIGKSNIQLKGNRVRIGFKVIGRGIVREDCDLYDGQILIGKTSSGTHLPFLNAAYGMAYIDEDHKELGTILEADSRGRKIKVEVVSLPFYKR